MKTLNPIRASVKVCPIITPGRFAQRPKVFSSPTKALVSGFGLLLLFGFSGHTSCLQAQAFNLDREAPGTIDEGPKVIKAARPAYPPIAAARRISGKVVVGVDIDADGMVTHAHAQSGHPILQTEAQSAALRWQFNSTRQDIGIRSAKLVFNFLKISSPNQEDGFSAPYQMVVRWEGIAVKTADPLPADSSSSNDLPNKSPLIKRIALQPVRWGRSVLRVFIGVTAPKSPDSPIGEITFEQAVRVSVPEVGEGDMRIRLRLHNNSGSPIILDMSGVPSKDYGDALLYYDVLLDREPIIQRQCHVCSRNALGPGKSLVFSVPQGYLSSGRAIRIRFGLGSADLNEVTGNEENEQYVYFSSSQLPRAIQQRIERTSPGSPATHVGTSERRRFQHSSVGLNKIDPVRVPLSGENGCDFSIYRPVRIEQYSRKAIIKRVQPDYPPEAAKSGVQGRVSVKALINKKGLVERACAIEGEKVLQRAAETAVLQWRFKPGYGIGFLRPKTELNPQNFAEAYVVFDFKLDKGAPEVTNAPKPAEISARARLNSENDPNKLISSGTSEPRHLQAKDWRKVNLKHFSFSLPKGMAPLRVRGTDSALWKYASSTLELTIDLGIYSEKPLDLSEDPQSREEQTSIDGKRATIVFARNDAADSLTYPYLAAAYFSNIGLQEVKLSFFATCATLEQQEIARKIFLSIDFRQPLAKVVEADKTVELRAHGAGRERPVWLSSDDLLRRVIERQPIERPGMLGRNSLKGVVTIQILIDKKGRVVYVRGVQGHPFGISSSINSLRRWRFRPYILNGRRKRIAGEVSLAFDFAGPQRLVFEGKVLRVGKPPKVLCGVVSPYRLAEYRVERIYEGQYDKATIVVDHLFCSLDVLSDLKPGDRVLIEADVREKIPERSNDGEIRRDTETVKTFYLAKRLTPAIGVATSERRRFQHSSVRFNKTDDVRMPFSGANKCDYTSYKPARLSHFTKLATLSRAFPVYPKEAAQRQIQGLVNVKILVNRTGNVVEACSVDGHPLLQEAARSAALQWKFKANYGFGKAKRGRKEVIPNEYVEDVLLFNFTLDKGAPNVSSAGKPAEILPTDIGLHQRKEIQATITYCNPDISEHWKLANLTFNSLYSFRINEKGEVYEITKLRDDFIGEEAVRSCLAKWRIVGVSGKSPFVVYFNLKHGKGWGEQQVSGNGFTQIMSIRDDGELEISRNPRE